MAPPLFWRHFREHLTHAPITSASSAFRIDPAQLLNREQAPPTNLYQQIESQQILWLLGYESTAQRLHPGLSRKPRLQSDRDTGPLREVGPARGRGRGVASQSSSAGGGRHGLPGTQAKAAGGVRRSGGWREDRGGWRVWLGPTQVGSSSATLGAGATEPRGGCQAPLVPLLRTSGLEFAL